MASSTIESAAKYIGNLLVEEIQNLAKVKDKVQDLQSELEWMQCFFFEVDVKQNKNALIRKWVLEIKDLALDAEDLIETYILKVSHKRQNKGLLNDLKWLSCCLRDAGTLHNVGSDIDALIGRISKMSSRLERYGVKSSYDKYLSHFDIDTKLTAEQRRTYAHVEDNKEIVGREESVNEVMNVLKGGKQKIVLVRGMGGIGKTTLARKVYNNRTLKDEFDCFAWAYISQQLQLGSVCREILLQLIPENNKIERDAVRKIKEDSLLVSKLYEKLRLTKQKYLVVLDDVWSKNVWKRLKPAFPVDDEFRPHGSKILMTTRDREILADAANGLFYDHELNLLDRDSSWQLLQNAANFRENVTGEKVTDPRVMLGKNMLNHCNGHPLAISVLGGVLATKTSVEEWQSVYDNLHSHLRGDDSYTGVYQVLAMSYYELPYHLKPCFLLLAHFPENFNIPVEKLYHIWIAEGIVSSTPDIVETRRSLDEICEIYMDELVQKGMVQVGSSDILFGKIRTCRPHDLMRDKCLEINREEMFLQNIDYQYACKNDPQLKIIDSFKKVRRMTIYVHDKVANSIPKLVSAIRSILFFPLETGEKIQDCKCIVALCKDFQLLRVLDFEGLELEGSLPIEIGSLIFLRYLSLKDTKINELPCSIEKLRALMILDLRVAWYCVKIKIPNVLWKMKSLRHMYLPAYGRYLIKEGNLLKLEQLRHLEKLENVDVDIVDAEDFIEVAGRLRKLSARCQSKKKSLVPVLISNSIKSLSIEVHARIVAKGLVIPLSMCNSLKELLIFANLSTPVLLPMVSWMFPQNLVTLRISCAKFPEDPMPMIERLCMLKSLVLERCYDGNELACSEGGFPELIHLTFDQLTSLTDWTVKKGGLPKLQRIIIYSSSIMKLPDRDVLPRRLSIQCSPCVEGIERYGTCPHFRGAAFFQGSHFGGSASSSHQ